MDSSLYGLVGFTIADFPELQQKLQTALEEIERLQLHIPIQNERVDEQVDLPDETSPDAVDDFSSGQLETKLHAANEHIANLQQEMKEKDQEIETLRHDLQQATDFTELLTFDVCSTDKVADMLDNELKATRLRVSKLSRELVVACQMLQSKHEEGQELAVSLQAAHETHAKMQKQILALKNLFADKVAANNSLHSALDVSKRMLVEYPALLQAMKEQQLAVEAAAALSAREAAQAKKAAEEAQEKISKLESSLSAPGSSPASSEEVGALKAELEAKTALLKAALKELEEANSHHQDLARSLSIKDDTIQHLHRQLRSSEHELQEQKAVVERMELERAATAAAAEAVGEEGGDARQERLAKQIVKLKEEQAESKKKLKEAQVNLARAESQILGAKTVLSAKNSQCHRLETELRVAESKLRELQMTHKAVSGDLSRRLEEASESLSLLESKYGMQVRQATTLERQLLHAKSQIADLLEGLGVEGSPLSRTAHNLVSFATNTSPSVTPTFQNPTSNWTPFQQTWSNINTDIASGLDSRGGTLSSLGFALGSGSGPSHSNLSTPTHHQAAMAAAAAAASGVSVSELLTRGSMEVLHGERYSLPQKTREQLDVVKGLLTQLGATVELAHVAVPPRVALHTVTSITA